MSISNYSQMYKKINKILGVLTPLRADCGVLCNRACCKGENQSGMLLFPHETTRLAVVTTNDGLRLAVCDGFCTRDTRPLACKLFPFFPTVDHRGRVFVEEDARASRLCPMIQHSEEILFDKRFLNAVKKVGKLLAKDVEGKAFLVRITQEIDTYRAFL